MKIVVIGGTGLVGSKTVDRLRRRGHEVVAASPSSGVNTLTGEGLAETLAGASVVIDLANAPSYDDQAVMDFFTTSTQNLMAAERAADVKLHVALSIVGSERLPDNGYFRAKLAQEGIVANASVPYTLIHSTQFFEFLGGIADAGASEGFVHISPAYVQPIAADDVADIIADIALEPARNGMVEIAGPKRVRFSEIVGDYLAAVGDARPVVADVHARYFGADLTEMTLVPGEQAVLGKKDLKAWLRERDG